MCKGVLDHIVCCNWILGTKDVPVKNVCNMQQVRFIFRFFVFLANNTHSSNCDVYRYVQMLPHIIAKLVVTPRCLSVTHLPNMWNESLVVLQVNSSSRILFSTNTLLPPLLLHATNHTSHRSLSMLQHFLTHHTTPSINFNFTYYFNINTPGMVSIMQQQGMVYGRPSRGKEFVEKYGPSEHTSTTPSF